MNQCKPDLIGTQEMNIYWYKALQTTLPDYDAYGCLLYTSICV